jgi:hypothetical protein
LRPDLEQYYLIDQYLDNKLKGEELTAFENQLMQDSSFAKEVEEQRMLNNFILEAELKDVRIQIEKDLLNIQKPSFFRMHWKWIGAGLLSISSILYFAVSNNEDVKQSNHVSSVHSIENKKQPVIDVIEKTNKPTPAVDNTRQTVQETKTVSGTGVNKSTDVVAEIKNNSSFNTNEAITPTVTIPENTNPAPKIETKPTEVTKTIDCSLTKISFSVTTETSCENTETGAIHIDRISGGIAPYSYTVNNKKVKEKNLFELAAGTYEVKISDKNGCSSEHKTTISEKNCTPSIQQGMKFNINPTIGETCSIPFNTDKKGNITIYNRGGKIIYKATDPSSDYIEWNGADGYGALAEAGLYVYIIEYTDGTKVTGEVNIIR